jgi:hypothetical protein
MKSFFPLFALFLFLSCSPSTPPTTISLTGTPGSPVTGYYIRDGRRTDFNATLPHTFTYSNLSVVAVRKLNPADTFKLDVRNPTGSMSTSSPAGKPGGYRLEFGGGYSCTVLDPDEPLSPPNNSLMTINPYWHNGTWVFDDARAGLVKEPFVAGAPEIITEITKDIPDAKAGVRLTFSAQPFPTQQHMLTWLRAESGGNVYRLDSPKMEGWLCPALFQYFRDAPKRIYVRADPKS